MVDRGKQKFGPNQLQRGRAIFTGTKFVNYNGQYFIWVENLVRENEFQVIMFCF